MTRSGAWIGWLVLALAGCDGGGEPTLEQCSSGEAWTGGDEESPFMKPGGDCIGCHALENEGPAFTIAGTVMGALDDVEDCFGVEGAIVRITDADGQILELTTNRAGNFYTSAPFTAPFNAEVELGGAISQMVTPQTDGNCASCHTEVGANSAPGRILAP
jgi:hypothetical protein